MSLCIIHLSDIHLKTKDDIILSRVDSVCRACASVVPVNSDVAIVISGDIAFSGKIDEYNLAKGIFIKLSKYLEEEKNARVKIVTVPGNHDCDFSKENSVRKALLESIQKNIDNDIIDSILKVQQNYFNFAKDYCSFSGVLIEQNEIDINGNKILFLLANTAWMSTIKETPGKIVMPEIALSNIDSQKYKVVIYVLHHPVSWLNPDCKSKFIEHIRKNADIVLLGHEHLKDSYQKTGDKFSVFCNHGKELQDSESENSAFSIIVFDDVFQNYKLFDFMWFDSKYIRNKEESNQFHKNISSQHSVFSFNSETRKRLDDLGVVVNHFAKEHITLSDLFVWPYLKKINYNDSKKKAIQIQNNISKEILDNEISIVTGAACGKTSLAKMLCMDACNDEKCCIFVDGNDISLVDTNNIEKTIEQIFVKQYNLECLEDFRQLSKKDKLIIIDNFDAIKNNKNRRSLIVDYIMDNFSKVVLFISNPIEIATIITSKYISSFSDLFYYDILPLGNKKRKELIYRWYCLGDDILSQKEVEDRTEKGIRLLDTMLGNGSSFIPALPIFIVGVLQNCDAKRKSYENSKYAGLYESFILDALSKISYEYITSSECNIDINIMSKLAFSLLKEKHTNFSKDELVDTIRQYDERMKLETNPERVLQNMTIAQIIYEDIEDGMEYKFRYPYIFYYFAGRYIAHNLNDTIVKEELNYMSSRLYNEIYGNIIIFVCHFSNSKEVIESVLLNAYGTLENYKSFDFTKSNPIFDKIHETIEKLIPKTVGSNEEVDVNRAKALERKDEMGIGDGQVEDVESEIVDDVNDEEKEKELASVVASIKTLEVLGQILQNYPGDIEGCDKTGIIDEIHKLGMRAVTAIVNTIEYAEQDYVEYVFERAKVKDENISRDKIVNAAKQLINLIIFGAVRGMVYQIAVSLNSEYLLPAATEVLSKDGSISSKLVLIELELNCLNKPNYREIELLKKAFEANNEKFAINILSTIITYYLNYNKCDGRLRQKLCALFEISEKQTLIESQKNLLI